MSKEGIVEQFGLFFLLPLFGYTQGCMGTEKECSLSEIVHTLKVFSKFLDEEAFDVCSTKTSIALDSTIYFLDA